jgi:hypothetical protein
MRSDAASTALMPDTMVDLNSVAITADLAKAIDYGQPFSHLEMKILNQTGGPVCIAAFVPVSLLRDLYHLAIGNRVIVRGEIGFSRSGRLP